MSSLLWGKQYLIIANGVWFWLFIPLSFDSRAQTTRSQNLYRSTMSANMNDPEPPNLTNPKRVRKLTKFFGEDPPLMRLFLRSLGYEVISRLPKTSFWILGAFILGNLTLIYIEICESLWSWTSWNDWIAVFERGAFAENGCSVRTSTSYSAGGSNLIMQRYYFMHRLKIH